MTKKFYKKQLNISIRTKRKNSVTMLKEGDYVKVKYFKIQGVVARVNKDNTVWISVGNDPMICIYNEWCKKIKG